MFVASGIRTAMRMRHIVICGLSRSTIFFSHYLTHDTIFENEVTEHKPCVLIFCTNLSETFFILRRTERDMITNVYRSLCKVPFILIKPEFFRQIFEKKIQLTSSVYDCTVEDVEYIYNKLSI